MKEVQYTSYSCRVYIFNISSEGDSAPEEVPTLRLFNPYHSKIQEFICRLNNIVKYLDNFPLFRAPQVLPDNVITNLVEVTLTGESQKQILLQVFDSASNFNNNLAEFCK